MQRASSRGEALAGALLVACATTATAPLFHWSEGAPGEHINAIGAFTPELCEVDAEPLAHPRIVVDQRESALVEAGDLRHASGRIARPESRLKRGNLGRGLTMV